MKIRLEQLNPTIGDIEGNVELMIEALADAEADNIDLLVLSELIVCGYSPMDLLERPAFLQDIYNANEEIRQRSKETALLFGTVTPNSGTGRKCFNSALLVQQGEVAAEVNKALLPTYDVYDEHRYFEPGESFSSIDFQGRKLGITICEDIWGNFELPYLSYNVDPVTELAEQGAEAIFNLSASPYSRNKPNDRLRMLQRHSVKHELPIFYTNQVGANTELISDGDSLVLNSAGEVVNRAPLFERSFIDFDWESKDPVLVNEEKVLPEIPNVTEQMFSALVLGLQDYLRKTGVADHVVLGLSGGIDSALAATIAAEALGSENVVGITMPSEFSSEGSITDSEKLAKNLGIKLHELAIKEVYQQFNDLLQPLFEGTDFGVAEENLQPRIRSTLLMAYSNKFGHMLLNTGNKSELATGYATLYGDMAGGLAVISDLYKTEVFEMAHWLNEEYFGNKVIPQAIIDKPPSAELRPNQKDADILPNYNVLDPILKAYIEEQISEQDIVNRGFDVSVVERVTAMVDRMEYKRFQAAPGLKVSAKAFGTGRRWPLVQKWTKSRQY